MTNSENLVDKARNLMIQKSNAFLNEFKEENTKDGYLTEVCGEKYPDIFDDIFDEIQGEVMADIFW